MLKKWSVFGLFILSILFSPYIYSQPFQLDTCYMPLAIGSKWIFTSSTTESFSGTHVYCRGIEIIEITQSKIVNGKEYFYYIDRWVRYDKDSLASYSLSDTLGNEQLYCDFRYIDGQAYPGLSQLPILKKCIVDTMTIMDSLFNLKGYYYSNYFDENSVKYLYSNNIGLSYHYVSGGHGASGYCTKCYLVGVYNADPSLGISKQDNSTPVISEPSFTITSINDLNIYVEVKHKYSSETIHRYNGTPFTAYGCCFIDSVYMDYFYCKGIDTIRGDRIVLDESTEIKFTKKIDWRDDLIADGYQIFYKITAKDINIFPHYTTYPAEGYLEMNYNLDKPLALYPLAKNNMWIYKKTTPINAATKYLTMAVEGDTILSNGLRYYKVLFDGQSFYQRIDSTTGFVYQVDNANNKTVSEHKKEFLAASINSTASINNFGIQSIFICSSISNNTLLGLNSSCKTYCQQQYTNNTYTLKEGLGLTYANVYENGSAITHGIYELKATRINGISYGDTTLFVDVKEENISQPATFALSQNYPNPFNPNTTIQYSIPESGMVELKVYDVLGREVKTLINGFVEVGNHSVNFNASNLSSGVYFYSIKYAGKNTITKKMVLTK